MNLYELDSKTRNILHSDNFLENLSATDFIEEILQEHEISLTENKHSLEQLDPKPFIRTFESVLTELQQLKKKNSRELATFELEVNNYEINHSRNVVALSNKIQDLNLKFDNLDNIVNNVGDTINPLGEKLQFATTLKEKNIEIIFLIRCYNDFYKYNQSKLLTELQKSKKSIDKKNCGKYISKLLKLASKLSTSNKDNEKFNSVYQEILQFSNLFETNLIEQFTRANQQENLVKMKESFDILIDYNETSTEIFSNYLSNNQPIAEEEYLLNNPEFFTEQHDFWKLICDPTVHYNYADLINLVPELPELLAKFTNLIVNQFNLIKIIFNKSKFYFLKILDMMLKKIFNTRINTIYANMLNFSQSLNNLTYVRLLHLLYTGTTEFVTNVKQFFVENYSKIFLEEVRDTLVVDDLVSILDSSFNELFAGNLTEKNYIEKEKKSLEDIYYKINNNFEKKYPKIFKDKPLSMRLATTDSIKELNIMSPISPSLKPNYLEKNKLIQLRSYMKSKLERTSSTSSKFSSLNDSLLLSPKLDQVNGIFSELRDDSNQDLNFEDIKLSNIDFMIQNSVESLSRISDLKPLNIPEYSFEILHILIFFGTGTYLEFGLEISYYKLIHLDFKKNEFLKFDFLKIINKANKILKLLTDFIKLIIVPLSINNPKIKKKITHITNGYLTTCELSLNILLKDSVELIVNKINFILDKQRKKDFYITNKKIDDLGDDEFNNTETCQDIIDFINDIYQEQLLNEQLITDSNVTNFLIEIGINLLTLLVAHFKKYQINEIGGIIVTKDIIAYQSMIDNFKIPELSEKFSILRELANLFTVQPNYINSLVNEGQLVNLNPEIIQQYVGKRSDYNSSFMNKFW